MTNVSYVVNGFATKSYSEAVRLKGNTGTKIHTIYTPEEKFSNQLSDIDKVRREKRMAHFRAINA